jgi:uncharacterized membrane protein
MEETVSKMAYAINFHSSVIEDLLPRLEKMATEFALVRNTVYSMIRLLEREQKVSLDSVSKEIIALEQESLQARLNNDLKNGFLVKIDKVEGADDLVSFSSGEDVKFALASIKDFPTEALEKFIGKTDGDVIDQITLSGVYRVVDKSAKKEEPTTPATT